MFSPIVSTKISGIHVFFFFFLNMLPLKIPSLIFLTLTLAYNVFSHNLATEKITRMREKYIEFFWATLTGPNSILSNSKPVFRTFYSVHT